ncbi:MAG: oxidoreductase [Ilumatobacteraceae bacterium]
MAWSTADIPDLDGMTALVTGSNTGIGLETASALATAGADVVLACRNVGKAEVARTEIERRGARGKVEILQLDLASQAQIADAAAEVLERFPRIHRLINNAGVMADQRAETEDGHELLLGTNHFGHFAFTGRILPAVLAAPNSRVVTVTCLSQKVGRLRWDDLHLLDGFRPLVAYAQSKLANITFALALQKRLAAAGEDTGSLVAHSGFADTNVLPGGKRELSPFQRRFAERFVQTPADASRPSLRAATDPRAYGGEFYGPSHRLEINGSPVAVRPSRRALDEDEQRRLWDVSVEHTGVEFPLTER